MVRLAVYGFTLPAALEIARSTQSATLVLIAAASAFAGSYFGMRLLKKVTLRTVELTVAVLMIAVGCGLVSGLL